MAITKASYKDLKEYWDYQRLLEYNRELIKYRLKKVQGNVFTQFGELNTENMFDNIWYTISNEDLEKPHEGWIPEDEKYRFDWEGKPKNFETLRKKGRPAMYFEGKKVADFDSI